MPLTLTSRYDDRVPLEVESILPHRLTKPGSAVANHSIWRGRRKHCLSDFFDIEGSLENDCTIVWKGPLRSVNRIGQGLESGQVMVQGSAGDHVGSQMSGGTIEVQGDVRDFAGTAMTGGQLTVHGSAGRHLGGCLPGAKHGMNRGTIYVAESAGPGVGQLMRRGTIVVGGACGDSCGWNMVAGTIIVLGGITGLAGVEMRRGTIVDTLPFGYAEPFRQVLPTFTKGDRRSIQILRLLKHQLSGSIFGPQSLQPLDQEFQIFHGDPLHGGRGELLVSVK